MKNSSALISSFFSTNTKTDFSAVKKEQVEGIGALCFLGCLLLAISSKIQVPFWPVPMTMQTFVVFIIGMSYGFSLASYTLIFYLLLGGIGAPVFVTFNRSHSWIFIRDGFSSSCNWIFR